MTPTEIKLLPPMRFSWRTTDVELEETKPGQSADFSVWVITYNGTINLILTAGDRPPTDEQQRQVLDRHNLVNVPTVPFDVD